MENYLVTGAAGFIGAAVAKKLIETGHQVTTIDNLSTGYRQAIPKNVRFLEGDCQDARLIGSLNKENFDAILHIAGQSSGEISFDDPVYDLQTNTQSTLLLLKLARKTGCQKFIYASTMSVYGDQPEGPVKEKTVPVPRSFYAVGKLASEQYLRIYQQYGINSVALRLFNVYGPGQNLENLRQGMVSIYLAMALKDQKIVVKGAPERFRDFVYIDDVVDAFLGAMTSTTSEFKVWNVGTRIKTTVQELLTKMQKYLPQPTAIEFKGSTPGDMFGIQADINAIQSALSWRPKHDLDTGLKKMVSWARGI